MKLKKWLSLPIIVGGLLAFVPYNYFSHHHKITHPPTLKAYTMSYSKYLQDMKSRKSLANADPMQLSATESDPPLLGYGYDLTNGTFSNKNAFSNFDDIGVKIVPLETTYSFESITSQNQLNSDLGVDGSMSFGFKHFALSGATSFQHKVINDTSDIHISFRMKTDVIELFDYNNKAQLSDKAKALVDSKDSTTFFNEYDAKYTTKLYATREVLFNLDMQLDSSVSKTDVKAKINFKKGLLSLEGAFEAAYGTNSSNSRISMSTLALPGGRVIYPSNSNGNISGNSDDRNQFLSDMQSTASSYVNFDNDKTQKSNPSQYLAKGITKKQLDSYSYYYKPSVSIVNPNIDELKEFPQLNQYYYLYQNMVEDFNKLQSWNNKDDLFMNKFNYYINLLRLPFSKDNQNYIDIFKNHNLIPFENEFQHYDNIIFSDLNFVYKLKINDWVLHNTYINDNSYNGSKSIFSIDQPIPRYSNYYPYKTIEGNEQILIDGITNNFFTVSISSYFIDDKNKVESRILNFCFSLSDPDMPKLIYFGDRYSENYRIPFISIGKIYNSNINEIKFNKFLITIQVFMFFNIHDIHFKHNNSWKIPKTIIIVDFNSLFNIDKIYKHPTTKN